MPLIVYQKKLSPSSPPNVPNSDLDSLSSRPKIKIHLFPLITSLVGLVLVASVVWPVLSYELATNTYQPATTDSGLLIPLVESNSQVLAIDSGPKVIGNTDYTRASNWFPSAVTTPTTTTSNPLKSYSSYYLTITKLRISKALVQVDSDDLTKALVHYPGTSLPGDYGNAVVFGHSVLPQFYNPQNYMSIFSLLPTLIEGDEILVEADNVTYTYKVSHKEEVYPNDLSPLEQHFDVQQIKLITCVPPGLKTRRLVVTADLKKT